MVTLTVNGQSRSFDGDPEMPLLWYLRDVLQMTGTKFGCGMALCGVAIRACVTPVKSAGGKKVTTIEGLDGKGEHPLQVAWRDLGVPQCGYCQSGQIMQAASLLASNKSPSDADIDAAMTGNICRCGTYTRVKAAIKQAAAKKGA
jgi:isoquinoline 1-oxidoreductase alpha subunit